MNPARAEQNNSVYTPSRPPVLPRRYLKSPLKDNAKKERNMQRNHIRKEIA